MRIRVYLRPDTVLILLAKKDQSQTWLAGRVGVSVQFVNMMINQHSVVPRGMQDKIFNAFAGTSHKPGVRLTKDDLFAYDMTEAS